ncbi:MAG: hypothetical protein COB02_06145 [Candidatus Cloacimonadota bacterium]|nr:MAG: hypothetical protein COB02_06145 [Candidatus Cloacimonadota bacterium]
MYYSKSAEYAIRALTVMSTFFDGKYFQVKQITRMEEISPTYLSKILRDLTKAGILNSVRGPAGGFSLARPAEDISLKEVVEVIDGCKIFDGCLLGDMKCGDRDPCEMHDSFEPIRLKISTCFKSCNFKLLGERYASDRKESLAEFKKFMEI